MHDSRAGANLDEIGVNHAPAESHRAAVLQLRSLVTQVLVEHVERRHVAQPDEVGTSAGAHHLDIMFGSFGYVLNQSRGDVEVLADGLIVDQGVVDIRPDCREVVADQGPRGRCPDQECDLGTGVELGVRQLGRSRPRVVGQRKPNVDRWVLDCPITLADLAGG